jgi:hypothetical protein
LVGQQFKHPRADATAFEAGGHGHGDFGFVLALGGPVPCNHLQVPADLAHNHLGRRLGGHTKIAEPLSVSLDFLKESGRQGRPVVWSGRAKVEGGTVSQDNVGCHTLMPMADHLTATDVVRLASATHLRASRMCRPSSLLGWWHERKFVDAIDHFSGALRSLPQREVEAATDDQIRHIGTAVDAIVNDVETFIGRHGTSSLKRVEQDRHLVKRIYELRASFEKLSRGVTAQPGMTDLRWKVRMDTAHRS